MHPVAPSLRPDKLEPVQPCGLPARIRQTEQVSNLPLDARVLVRAPKLAALVAALLVRDGRMLLCHRSAGRRWYPDVWDFPGGHVEGGESPMLESDWVPRVLEAREEELVRQQYGMGGKPRRRMPLLERIIRRRKIAD